MVGTNDLTIEALGKLVWLEACMKESWRLYPVVPLIARQINSPIKISTFHNNSTRNSQLILSIHFAVDHDIPIGSTVLINSFLLHRDPRHFSEPESYRPERFLPNSAKNPSYAYIPFSAGSRNCIGWKFATMTVKVSLLSVLKSYHVESLDREDQLRYASEIVMVNHGGIRLKITPRQKS